ncbi:MAG: hypothetical protein HFP81_00280 [Methylococcales symbiont of Hymedesmia sp. n. MRB-2018]|nr:MAG: hypothetical protein HFP78_00160 [Methylococcales symbiont of Hymedesmia sp. n. MRB-2018]KAF3984806.1 MAG: hypothetical protein HFP81_00280 [Methylococcales symbiont of Hymedesmia sp. n. MRB-2018]
MSFLSKLFGHKSKAEEMKVAAVMFDTAKNEFLRILIKGLSDPEQRERQGCANLIQDKVIPALDLDNGPASKAASLATIQKLISELRPPKNDGEMNDLNNAAFHYMRLQLQQRSKQ